MRILFISNLFPNEKELRLGIFNRPRIKHWSRYMEVQVIAPLSWFPIPGKYAHPKGIPAEEVIDGVKVYHPRSYYLPKVGRTLNPLLFAASIFPLIRRIHSRFNFDQIHVDWLYPDACGVSMIARLMNVPLTVSVAGSDANIYLNYWIRRRQILRALEGARAVITRSAALKHRLEEAGVNSKKVHVIYNGVDCEQFQPLAQDVCRQQLKIPNDGPVLLYVGNLVPVKGVADLLSAFGKLRHELGIRATLIMVGDGYLRKKLEEQACQLNLEDGAIRWTGNIPPKEIGTYMSAANVVCLASHAEGVPNVLLEANACGRPFVATNVGGIPEITVPGTGLLAPAQDPAAFAGTLKTALETCWDSQAIRRHALQFSWKENANQVTEIFRLVQINAN